MRKLIVASVLFVSQFSIAQSQAPAAHGAGGTLTRSASKYKDLETALLQAQQDKRQDDVNRMVDDDFEVWSAEKNEPTPRDVWVQGWMTGNSSWFQIRNVAVREFGDIAVVSFLLDRRGEMGDKPVTPTVFVVDVWRQGTSKLVVRYVSSPGKPAPQVIPTRKE